MTITIPRWSMWLALAVLFGVLMVGVVIPLAEIAWDINYPVHHDLPPCMRAVAEHCR